MHVLLIIHNQYGSGPYQNAARLAKALVNGGEQVTLLCTSRTSRIRMTESLESGVTVAQAPDLLVGRLRQGVDAWNAFRRIRYVRKGEYDVVHAIDSRPAVIAPALWLRWRRNVPLVLSWWDMFGRGGSAVQRSGELYARTAGRVETFFEERFRRFADRATVVSTFLRDRLQQLGYPRDRILLQRVGVDTARARPCDKAQARLQLDIPEGTVVLCYLGSIFPADANLLVESLRTLQAEYGGRILTIMAGPPSLSPEAAQKVGARVLGWQPQEVVDQCLCAADLTLLPMLDNIANKARWPSKVGDYWAAGRPVVATGVSDLPSLVPEHGLGYLAREATPDAFADAVLQAIQDRSAWKDMERTCREFAERHLETRRIAAELVEFYREALYG